MADGVIRTGMAVVDSARRMETLRRCGAGRTAVVHHVTVSGEPYAVMVCRGADLRHWSPRAQDLLD